MMSFSTCTVMIITFQLDSQSLRTLLAEELCLKSQDWSLPGWNSQPLLKKGSSFTTTLLEASGSMVVHQEKNKIM